PHLRAEDRDRLVGQLLRVLGVEVLRPVDARVRVPLEVLRLLVEPDERVAGVLVLPAEDGVELAGNRPLELLDGDGVAAFRAHRGLPLEETHASRRVPSVVSTEIRGLERPRVAKELTAPPGAGRAPGGGGGGAVAVERDA